MQYCKKSGGSQSWSICGTISVAARYEAGVCLLGLRVRIPPESWISVLSVVWCQVVSGRDRSFAQRRATECHWVWPGETWVCSRSLDGVAGSKPAGVMDVCFECCVLSGAVLCEGPIIRLEESYRVPLSVTRCKNKPLHLQWESRRTS